MKYDPFDTKEIEQAREDGANARWDGFQLRDNPYGAPELKRAWEDGWTRHGQVLPPILDDEAGEVIE